MSSDKINKTETAEVKRELTPEQIRKRKQLLIFPLFFLIFAGIMYLIFAPSGKDKENENQGLGYNAELPMPKEEEDNLRIKGAYEKDEFEGRGSRKDAIYRICLLLLEKRTDLLSNSQKTNSRQVVNLLHLLKFNLLFRLIRM